MRYITIQVQYDTTNSNSLKIDAHLIIALIVRKNKRLISRFEHKAKQLMRTTGQSASKHSKV